MSAVSSFSQCKGTKKKAKDNGVYRMTKGVVQDDGREEGEEGGESEHRIFFLAGKKIPPRGRGWRGDKSRVNAMAGCRGLIEGRC